MIFLLNQRYVNMYVLDVLSSFNYVEVSMMFMRNYVWLKSDLNWFEGFECEML